MYCRTREGCQSLADKLSSKGIKARAYHAGEAVLQVGTLIEFTGCVCVCV